MLPDEDAAEFAALEAALIEELAPEGALQTVLAKRVVAASWRLERAERLEAELFAHETYEMFGKAADLGLALIRDCNGAGAFDTLLRYRGGTLAELWRALRTLKALKAEAAQARDAPARRTQPKEPESRGNPRESDRPSSPADAGKGDVNPTLAWPPSWPFSTPGPAPCMQPIKPEGLGKPAESAPPSSPNRTAARNGNASLLAGTALASVGRPGSG